MEEQKKWFVLYKGAHHGPYSASGIRQKLGKARFGQSVLLWRPGMERWRPLKFCPEFAKSGSTPPPPKKSEPTGDNRKPAPVVLEKRGATHKKVLAVALGLLAILFPGFVFFSKSPQLHPGRHMALRACPDGEDLCLVGKYTGRARLFLRLDSRKGEVLQEGPVRVTSWADLSGGRGRFSRLRFVAGESLVPGKYRATVYVHPVGLGPALGLWLASTPLKMIFPRPVSMVWHADFVFAPQGLSSLDRQLAEFRLNLKRPVLERLQVYQTFAGQLGQIERLYHRALRAENPSGFIRIFTSALNSQTRPLLQELILAGRRSHLALLNSAQDESWEYEKLMNDGKSLAALVARMTSKVQGVHTFRGRVRKQLQESFSADLASLRSEIHREIQSLKAQLKKTH